MARSPPKQEASRCPRQVQAPQHSLTESPNASFRPFSRSAGRGLHIGVVRPAAALGRCPVYILTWVLDVARFTVNAVLRIDLEPRIGPSLIGQHFIHASRAISCRRFGILGQVYTNWDGWVLQHQVNRLIFFMIGVGKI